MVLGKQLWVALLEPCRPVDLQSLSASASHSEEVLKGRLNKYMFRPLGGWTNLVKAPPVLPGFWLGLRGFTQVYTSWQRL